MSPDDSSGDEVRADGWDAITAALQPTYGDQEPKHYGTVLPMSLGGKDPLQGISVYVNNEDKPHWHYVTYGFSELYEKESDDPDVSGFGFELTFRLKCNEGSDSPPAWPLNFLQNIARYVFRSGNRFAQNHHVNLNGPIALDEATDITGAAFVLDPQLGRLETKNGRLDFLQIVGLCTNEYELVKQWNCASLMNFLRDASPLLITDLARASLLSDERLAQSIRSAVDAEGSSQAVVYGTRVDTAIASGILTLSIAANIAGDVKMMFKGRLGHGNSFLIHGPAKSIAFEPAEVPGWRTDDNGLPVISAGRQFVDEFLRKVEPRRGIYRFESFPNLMLEIVPTEIKDADGKVIRVIG